MAVTLLEELKEYLHLDSEDEDTTLNTFLIAAQQTLINAGVKIPKVLYQLGNNEDKFALHRLAICNLAAHYYENRQVVTNTSQNMVPFSVQTMILQLKWVDIDESSEI